MDAYLEGEPSHKRKVRKVRKLLARDVFFPQKTAVVYSWAMKELAQPVDGSTELLYLDLLLDVVRESEAKTLELKPSFFRYAAGVFQASKTEAVRQKTFSIAREVSARTSVSYLEKSELFRAAAPSEEDTGALLKEILPHIKTAKTSSGAKFVAENILSFLSHGCEEDALEVLFSSESASAYRHALKSTDAVGCLLGKKRCHTGVEVFDRLGDAVCFAADSEKRAAVLSFFVRGFSCYASHQPETQLQFFSFLCARLQECLDRDAFVDAFSLFLPAVRSGSLGSSAEMQSQRAVFSRLFKLLSKAAGKETQIARVVELCGDLVEESFEFLLSFVEKKKVDVAVTLLKHFDQKRELDTFFRHFLSCRSVSFYYTDKTAWTRVASVYLSLTPFFSKTLRDSHRKTFCRIIRKNPSKTALGLFSLFVGSCTDSFCGWWVQLFRKDVGERMFSSSAFRKAAEEIVARATEQQRERMAAAVGLAVIERHSWMLFLFAAQHRNKKKIEAAVLRTKQPLLLLRYISHFGPFLSQRSAVHIWDVVFGAQSPRVLSMMGRSDFFEVQTMRKHFQAFLSQQIERQYKNEVLKHIPRGYFSVFPFRESLTDREEYLLLMKKHRRSVEEKDIEVFLSKRLSEYRSSNKKHVLDLWRVFSKKRKQFLSAVIKNNLGASEDLSLFVFLSGSLSKKVARKNEKALSKLVSAVLKKKEVGLDVFRALCVFCTVTKTRREEIKKSLRRRVDETEIKGELFRVLIETKLARRLKYKPEKIIEAVRSSPKEKIEETLVALLNKCSEEDLGFYLDDIARKENAQEILCSAVSRAKTRKCLVEVVKENKTPGGVAAVVSEKNIDSRTLDGLFCFLAQTFSLDTVSHTDSFLSTFFSVHAEKREMFFSSISILLVLWLREGLKDPARAQFSRLIDLVETATGGLVEKGASVHLLVHSFLSPGVEDIKGLQQALVFSVLRMCSARDMDVLLARIRTPGGQFRHLCGEYERERNMVAK
ncbi:MAG: uncharacterized protein A8A55_0902 [Amphiamblys sp. WSBS2006]|nr:MAG: uncharacterized protein A8A55_0902 [Amphiamblys sp. WSBS2006]